ncbi:hypothetical protein HDU98_009224 [Podochytrium sp. JEL0797]|nr:hypothetical protein HDU98_009224 [Podochytrium sp. JEL0797]
MLNRNDVPIKFILEGSITSPHGHIPYLQLIWSAALKGDDSAALAMAVLEKIILPNRQISVMLPRMNRVSRMGLVERTCEVVWALEDVPETVLFNAVEIVSRWIENCAVVESADLLFSSFVDPDNKSGVSYQIESILNKLESSRYRGAVNAIVGEERPATEALSCAQFQAGLNLIHMMAVKTSGRCPTLPTLVETIDKPNLKHMKQETLHLIAEHTDILWGPDSLLFGEADQEGSPLAPCVTTCNRIYVLELFVECMFYFIVRAKSDPNTQDERDASASIYQNLLYKMVYMALGGQHKESIETLCASKPSLLDEIASHSRRLETQGYFKLLLLAVEKFRMMFPEGELAKCVAASSCGWEEVCADCIGDDGAEEVTLTRKEDEVLAHVVKEV